ncbi:hypothetical protein ACE6H2_008472 [Prunus campanulata]
MATKVCVVIRSFHHPNLLWGLPPSTRRIALPESRVLYTVLRSPHIDKKSREQFEMEIKKQYLVIKTQPHELQKKFFWLKRQPSKRLQESLSKTLVLFYPLAGRLKGPEFIECNDEGAHFLEARVNCQLAEFLQQPEPKFLNHLIPETDSETAQIALGHLAMSSAALI